MQNTNRKIELEISIKCLTVTFLGLNYFSCYLHTESGIIDLYVLFSPTQTQTPSKELSFVKRWDVKKKLLVF